MDRPAAVIAVDRPAVVIAVAVRTAAAEAVRAAQAQRADNTEMFYAIEHIPAPECMQRRVEQLAMLVPVKRREQAFCYKHLHGQYCCLRTWQMLHELLINHAFLPASFPLSDLTFTIDTYGKPSLSEAVSFSISHTKNALAVAVSDHPIGIDIEQLISAERLRDRAFLDYTLSPYEQEQLRQLEPDTLQVRKLFTHLWTRKEALFKAQGTGINVRLLPTILDLPHPYTFLSSDTDDYCCSIAYLPSDI